MAVAPGTTGAERLVTRIHVANTLFNCVGGVVGCVQGCSPAFMGGWPPGCDPLQVSAERR
jgi:hypothetical protein